MNSTTTSPKTQLSIKIGDHDLSHSVMIVAEIGNNHEGDMGVAKEMISAAAESGANAVKFQTIEPSQLVSSNQVDRIEQLTRFYLSRADFEELAEIAKSSGVYFLSTPFYLDSVSWLDNLVPAFKIASGDCDYTKLLETVARTKKPILLSTGASTLEEVRSSQQTISKVHSDLGIDPRLVLLHCVVSYPTKVNDANLSALLELSQLGTVIGYSDHTIGTDAAVLSVGMGARLIEKHFTLDKNYSEFRDHALSADPDEMADLIKKVRHAEILIGSAGKNVLPCEEGSRSAVRRSVHASIDLQDGHNLSPSDTLCLRPADGIPPTEEASLVGRTLKQRVKAGMQIATANID